MLYRAGQHIRSKELAAKSTICVGKEWHRVPSTLFVSDVAAVRWIDDGFDGQLPAEFEATDFVNEPFNDRNEGDESRFVETDSCDFIMDLWERDQAITAYDRSKYKVIESAKFLDRAATGSGIFRSFYIPFISAEKVVYGDYVFLGRKAKTANNDK